MKKTKTAAEQKKVTTNARVRERKPRIVRSDELVATILNRVAKGEPLSKVCDQPDMPTRKSFFEWLSKDATMVEAYKLATEMRADLYAEEILEIADDGTRDYKADSEGREVVDHDHIARARLRVEARKWYVSKLAPKKYGDKVDLNHGGQEGNPLTALFGLLVDNSNGRIRPAK
jgi:hypothetical protein